MTTEIGTFSSERGERKDPLVQRLTKNLVRTDIQQLTQEIASLDTSYKEIEKLVENPFAIETFSVKKTKGQMRSILTQASILEHRLGLANEGYTFLLSDDLTPFNSHTIRGLPRLVAYPVFEDSKFQALYSLQQNTFRLGGTSDHPFWEHITPHFTSLRNWLFLTSAFADGDSRDSLTCTYNGTFSPQTRESVAKASKTFGEENIFIIAEPDSWRTMGKEFRNNNVHGQAITVAFNNFMDKLKLYLVDINVRHRINR